MTALHGAAVPLRLNSGAGPRWKEHDGGLRPGKPSTHLLHHRPLAPLPLLHDFRLALALLTPCLQEVPERLAPDADPENVHEPGQGAFSLMAPGQEHRRWRAVDTANRSDEIGPVARSGSSAPAS